MSDDLFRFLERQFAEGDWSAYPKIVNMRARLAELGEFGCYEEWTSGRGIDRPRGRLITIADKVSYRTRDGRIRVIYRHWRTHVRLSAARVGDTLLRIEALPVIGPLLAEILRERTRPA